jgi:hypothetical protein
MLYGMCGRGGSGGGGGYREGGGMAGEIQGGGEGCLMRWAGGRVDRCKMD